MEEVNLAIARTLAYADVFDYPLTKKEICRYLISPKKISLKLIEEELPRMNFAEHKDGYYFLKDQEKTILLRQQKKSPNVQKRLIAVRVAKWLRLIPTIKMVAITGALSMNNAQKEDDIDLLIISAKDRLWLTRALTVLLTELVASRRRPGDPPAGRRIRDKICLNMFLDETHLLIPEKERNLFTAHEICQLKLLWEKDNTYQRFMMQNQWVKKYLANWKP
jgi:hypothetical protein